MSTPYTSDFFSGISDGSRASARRVLPLVFALHETTSVVDVGCGAGAWLNACRQLGIADVTGLDGDYVAPEQMEIPVESFVSADLSLLSPATLAALGPRVQRRFDLAMSMEVAEHLPASSAHGFVDALCSLAPVVLFSAAIPHQGGTHHVNEQFPSYWTPHFARHGYVPVDALRRQIWGDLNVEWWYRQNIMLFATHEALAASPALAAARADTADDALDLIHPEQYQRVVEWAVNGWNKVAELS